MRKDYEILGIEMDADKKEIKKAYFKLIREYTPEKDPERFQEIRAAYERLMEEAEHPEKKIQLEFPADDKFAESMFDQIQQLIDEEDYSKALKTAEEGAGYYNDIECFLYMVARCSILNNNSGKAAKAYEKLVERYPDKIMYRGELARAYYMRGYANKAYRAFREAYAQGWRAYNFLMDYSVCCQDRRKFGEGIDILREYVQSVSPEDIKKYVPELLNAYLIMYTMAQDKTDALDEIVERILDFLDQAGRAVSEYSDMLASLYLAVTISKSPDSDTMAILADRLQKLLPKGVEFDGLNMMSQFYKAQSDERFGTLMRETIMGILDLAAMELTSENDYADFMLMDLVLCHIEEWPNQKSELGILKKEYPQVYELGTDLWEVIEKSILGRSMLKAEFLEFYARMERKYPGEGRYYKLYPERKGNAAQVQWDSVDSGTFMRSERKIGRNEPCPCGSGKKYKNCCGKK